MDAVYRVRLPYYSHRLYVATTERARAWVADGQRAGTIGAGLPLAADEFARLAEVVGAMPEALRRARACEALDSLALALGYASGAAPG